MKIFLLLLLSISPSMHGMQPADQLLSNDLSESTQEVFKEAFTAFNIPLNQVQLKKVKNDGTCKTDWESNVIEFDEEVPLAYPVVGQAALEFCAYHEVAHIADKKQLKKDTLIKERQGIITFGATSLVSCLLSGYTVEKSLSKYLFTTKHPLLAGISIGFTVYAASLFLGYKAAQFVVNRPRYIFEHRANCAATEKLLEKRKFLPIATYLANLKALEYKGKSRTHCSHPLVTEEYEHIQQCLAKKGYAVRGEYNHLNKEVVLVISDKKEDLVRLLF